MQNYISIESSDFIKNINVNNCGGAISLQLERNYVIELDSSNFIGN